MIYIPSFVLEDMLECFFPVVFHFVFVSKSVFACDPAEEPK